MSYIGELNTSSPSLALFNTTKLCLASLSVNNNATTCGVVSVAGSFPTQLTFVTSSMSRITVTLTTSNGVVTATGLGDYSGVVLKVALFQFR